MKENPILFSGQMVRAILEGRKTQTRRVVKPRKFDPDWPHTTPGIARYTACPYGQPGDRLWVRETLTAKDDYMVYAADGGHIDCGEMDWPACIEKRKTVPSIHMPRWASRILLEITSVRVERLADISREDAEDEGIGLRRVSESDYRWIDYTDKDGGHTFGDPRQSFWSLWKSINGPSSWAANPWVWVIEFKKVGTGETAQV